MVVGRGTGNTLRPSPSVLTQEAWLLQISILVYVYSGTESKTIRTVSVILSHFSYLQSFQLSSVISDVSSHISPNDAFRSVIQELLNLVTRKQEGRGIENPRHKKHG